MTGEHYLEQDNAKWAPVACSEHSQLVQNEDGTETREGDGFQDNCPACASQMELTQKHIQAVQDANTP